MRRSHGDRLSGFAKGNFHISYTHDFAVPADTLQLKTRRAGAPVSDPALFQSSRPGQNVMRP
jgi:hypothetical protein